MRRCMRAGSAIYVGSTPLRRPGVKDCVLACPHMVRTRNARCAQAEPHCVEDESLSTGSKVTIGIIGGLAGVGTILLIVFVAGLSNSNFSNLRKPALPVR